MPTRTQKVRHDCPHLPVSVFQQQTLREISPLGVNVNPHAFRIKWQLDSPSNTISPKRSFIWRGHSSSHKDWGDNTGLRSPTCIALQTTKKDNKHSPRFKIPHTWSSMGIIILPQLSLSDMIRKFDTSNVFLIGPLGGFIHDKYYRRKLPQLMWR